MSARLRRGNVHLGTGGGSIRTPAAFGDAYGIKPTRARVPAWPAAPLGTLAHVGCLTRCVADAALALTIMAAPDLRDIYAWTSPAPRFAHRPGRRRRRPAPRHGSATPSASNP